MPIWRQNVWMIESAQKPHLDPVVGGKLAKASRVVAAMRSQDKPTALGRRVIAAQSLAGDHEWLTGDGASDVALTKPHATTPRMVMRATCDVTPGHILRLSALVIPSGDTQVQSGSDWISTGASGSLSVTITWHDQEGGSVTSTHAVPLPISQLASGAAPQFPWTAIKLAKIWVVQPDEWGPADQIARLSRHVTADVQLHHIGGVRVIDAVLHEVPREVARAHDDDPDLWTSHIHAPTNPENAGPTIEWPVERRKSDGTDPRGGTWHLMDVAAAQGIRLGPQLISWTPYHETGTTVDETGIVPVTTSSATNVRLWDGVSERYRLDRAGWSMAAGAYARGYGENHPYWGEHDGSIPVVLAVYGLADDEFNAGVGVVRVQSAKHSWVEVEIDDRIPRWWFAQGHLRVGKGPGDFALAQAFFRAAGTNAFCNVSALQVYHGGHYVPALEV